MTGQRWHWIPFSLVAGGVALVCAAAAANFAALGWWELPILAGCAAALAAAFWFRRKLSAAEVELEAFRKRLADEESRLNTQRSEFEQLRLTIQNELAQEAGRPVDPATRQAIRANLALCARAVADPPPSANTVQEFMPVRQSDLDALSRQLEALDR